MPASCLLISAFDNRPCMAVSVYSKSASVWKGAHGQGSDRGWKMGPEASIERDGDKVNGIIVGVGSKEWGWGITLMNSSGRLGPSTYVFTLVPTGINSLDLLTGNGFLAQGISNKSVSTITTVSSICIGLHPSIISTESVKPAKPAFSIAVCWLSLRIIHCALQALSCRSKKCVVRWALQYRHFR
jgi:hypothetical protein